MAIKIAANLGSGFESTFKTANANLREIGSSLNDIKNVQKQVGQFNELESSISSTKSLIQETTDEQLKLVASISDSAVEAEKARKAYSKKQDELKKANAELKKAQSSGWGPSVEHAQKNVNRLNKETTDLKKVHEQHEKTIESLNVTYDKNQKVIDNSNNKLNDQKIKLKGLEADLNKAGINTKQLSKENENLTKTYQKLAIEKKKIDSLTSSIDKNTVSLTNNAKSLAKNVGAAGGLGASLYVSAIKPAIAFESAFTGVKKTVDATAEEFAELEKGIRSMAKELPKTHEEIAGVAQAAGQLGIANEHILEFSRTMIDMSESSNLTWEQASNDMARIANITGMCQTMFSNLGSSVSSLGNNFAATESEILSMGLRLSAAGTQVGLTEAEIMGISAALTSVGLSAEAGGTAFSKVLFEMQMASEMGGQSLEDFAMVAGKSADEFAHSFKTAPAEVIQAFLVGLSQMDEQGLSTIATLEHMGLTEIRLRDTLLRTSDTHELFANALEISNTAWEENIALSTEASLRYGTVESQLKIMRNNFKDVGITLGEHFLPYIVLGSQYAIEFANAIGNFIKENEELVSIIIKATFAILAFKIAFFSVKVAFFGVKGQILKTILLFTQLGTKLILLKGKFLKLFATVSTSLLKIFKLVKGIGLKSLIPALGAKLLLLVKPFLIIVAAIMGVISIVNILFGDLESLRTFIYNTFGEGALKVFDSFTSVINNIGEAIKNVFSEENLQRARGFIEGVFGPRGVAVFDAFIAVIRVLWNVIRGLVDFTVTYVQPIIEQIFSLIVNTVLPGLIDAFTAWAPPILSIVVGLVEGIKAMLVILVEAFKFAWALIENTVITALDIITIAITTFLNLLEHIIEFIVGVFTADWERAWNGIKGIFKSIMDGIVGIAVATVNGIIGAFNFLINKFGSFSIPDWVPGVGGKGFSIPNIPMFAKGTENTPDTFIAGEQGAELITGGANKKVFTALETNNIGSNLDKIRDFKLLKGNSSKGSTITYEVHNSPTIVINDSKDLDKAGKVITKSNDDLINKLKNISKDEERLSFG